MTDKPVFRHDQLFRDAMDNRVVHTEFLKMYLPENIQTLIDFDTLKLEREGFITKELRDSVSDILFSAKFGDRDGFLFLLLEHQSKPHHFMAFRMFKYMINICDRYLTQNPRSKQLPLIYPLVFYNGNKPYTVARNIWDLFSDPALARQCWTNDYQLIDVHSISDEELKKHTWAGTLCFFMKHIFDSNMLNIWREIENKIPELTKLEMGYDYIKVLLVYSLTKLEENDKIIIENLLTTKLGEERGEEIMASIAEKWYKDGITKGEARGEIRGEARGIAKGIEQRTMDLARNMLKQGADINFVSKVTGYTTEQIIKIKNNL